MTSVKLSTKCSYPDQNIPHPSQNSHAFCAYPCYFGEGDSAAHNDRWAPRGINRLELISLSSIVAPQAPKPILDFHHQNLREKAANFDWRADPLITKVKRAFGSRLADILEFITLGALLLAG
jgi:hypothetical protein